MTFYRLYSFYRRGGAGRIYAAKRALRSVRVWRG
jgi:hypothetical protein